MRQVHIIHLGIGRVGRELIAQISGNTKHLAQKFGIEFLYHGLFTSRYGIVDTHGMSVNTALRIVKNKKLLGSQNIGKAIEDIQLPFILIDTTASESTVAYIMQGIKRGGFVVLSNKKPLTLTQREFDILHRIGGCRIFYRTVVGAGLPIIKTIKDMQDSGDEIIEIRGCLSGTLGFIFSELDKGRLFSEVVVEAKKKGFTESDPRDDLSGIDVVRKALILSRLIGQKMELADIQCMSLYPKNLESLSTNEFLAQIRSVDLFYKTRVEKARKKNKVLRFIGEINNQGSSVGLQEVDMLSDFGRLKGPDNLVVIKTKRYSNNPLIIKGPGAGIEVTAAGVFADMLEVVKRVKIN